MTDVSDQTPTKIPLDAYDDTPFSETYNLQRLPEDEAKAILKQLKKKEMKSNIYDHLCGK